MKYKEKEYYKLADLVPEIVYELDSDGVITYVNNKAMELLGYSSEELIGINILNIIKEDEQDKAKRGILQTLTGQNSIKENYYFKRKNGDWMPFMLNASKVCHNGNFAGIIGIAVDQTYNYQLEKAKYYEFHDSLTDLPNREMLFMHIDAEIKKAQIYRRKSEKNKSLFAVMCIGLNKFKKINDMYGPIIGDTLLKKVGLKLAQGFREEDLVSKYVGDSFMILLSRITKYEEVIDIIQKTYGFFSDPFIIEDNIIRITCSIGVCLYPHDGQNKEQLVKNSESAMYSAKEHGRNTHRLYNAKMNEKMLRKLKIEKELEYAIYHNNFLAYFQPKYNIGSEIIGMESLIRWQSVTEKKIIYPSSFIPIAEENGMIIEIGNLILYQSCAQSKKWQEKGYPPIALAVNISPSQFKQPDLIENIKEVINKTGFDPQLLELEITESGIMENEKYNIRKLYEIHDLGVKITIDDFGKGYSSLSKLKDYPIDSLKIDKSFIENLPDNEKSSTITRTIIDLAHNLGFKVVAEGVERKEQLGFLYNHKCDEFQGYYFSPPLAPDEFEEKIKNVGLKNRK